MYEDCGWSDTMNINEVHALLVAMLRQYPTKVLGHPQLKAFLATKAMFRLFP